MRAARPRIQDVTQRLTEQMRRKAEISLEQEELLATLDEVSRHLLHGVEHEEVAALEKRRTDNQIAIQRIEADIGRLEERLENQRKELERHKDSIEKAQLSEKRTQDLQRRFSLARKSSDAVEGILEAFASEMRRSIEAQAKEIFQSLALKDSQFQDVQFGEDYHLEVIDRWGLPARPELSAGERQVLSLAFITGMAKVTVGGSPVGHGHSIWALEQGPSGGHH